VYNPLATNPVASGVLATDGVGFAVLIPAVVCAWEPLVNHIALKRKSVDVVLFAPRIPIIRSGEHVRRLAHR
jgi:hypothetical protein